MAHSRVCSACGHDTCRTAPFSDPLYGLTLVRCATCSAVMTTRRWPAYVGWWRRARHVGVALAVLACQVACAVVAIGGVAVSSVALHHSLGEVSIDPYSLVFGGAPEAIVTEFQWRLRTQGAVLIMIMQCGTALIAGCWIGSLLRHHGVLKAWAVVGALVLGATELMVAGRWWLGMESTPAGSPAWAESFGSLTLATIALLLAWVAVPPGVGLRRVAHELRRALIGFLLRLERGRRRRR